MKLSRRSLLTGAGAAPFILRSQQGPLRARVKIDTERVIGDIDPMIYRNFIEHLGRCIDGGISEENPPLSDRNGFRRDALQLFVDAPKYKSKRFDDIPFLDLSAGFDNGTVVLRTQPIEAVFETQDKKFAGPVEGAEINGPYIKAENDFDKTIVQSTPRSAMAGGTQLRYTFPPHSYAMLKAKLT